jgi:hypothetical protein
MGSLANGQPIVASAAMHRLLGATLPYMWVNDKASQCWAKA